MDINKVFPKPPEVEEEMRRQKELDVIRAEQEELARVKALAPVLVPPTMSQLMAAQIGSIYSEYIPKRLHFFFLMPSKMQYVDTPSYSEIYLVEGHSVDLPVSNPFLTDKLIDEELKQMMDMQVSEKRRGCVPSKQLFLE